MECVPAVKYHPGDIIVFRESGRLIAHRLLFRLQLGRRLYLYQKGDSAGIGHWVRDNKMVGVVTSSTDADGTYSYLRGKYNQAAGSSVYVHLLRDFLARARLAIKALCEWYN